MFNTIAKSLPSCVNVPVLVVATTYRETNKVQKILLFLLGEACKRFEIDSLKRIRFKGSII